MDLKDLQQTQSKVLNSRNQIRKRYIEELEGESYNKKNLEDLFRPVTDIVSNVKANVLENISTNAGNLKALMQSSIRESKESRRKLEDYAVRMNTDSLLQSEIPKLQDVALYKPQDGNVIMLGPIAAAYLASPAGMDHSWGLTPVVNHTTLKTEYYLGNKIVQFHGDDIIFDGYKYKGTQGLWELLTMKNPGGEMIDGVTYFDHIKGPDKRNYLEMIEKSGIHLTENGKIRSSGGYKYVNFISPWWSSKTQTPVRLPSTPASSNVTINRGRRRDANTTHDESRQGEGVKTTIKFLSRNPSVLLRKLNIILGNIASGHTNIDYNELSSIADELYNQKKISVKMYEQISTMSPF